MHVFRTHSSFFQKKYFDVILVFCGDENNFVLNSAFVLRISCPSTLVLPCMFTSFMLSIERFQISAKVSKKDCFKFVYNSSVKNKKNLNSWRRILSGGVRN